MARPTKTDPDQPPEQSKLSELDPTLNFICHDLVRLAVNSPTVLALRESGMLDLQWITMCPDEVIDKLTYTPIGTKTTQDLTPIQRAPIRWIRDWNAYLMHEAWR